MYNGESVGVYDMPLIRKQDIDVEKMQLLCYADARNGECENCGWKLEKDADILETK